MWSLDATLPVSESALEDGASGAAEETPRSVELCGHTALCLSNTGLANPSLNKIVLYLSLKFQFTVC